MTTAAALRAAIDKAIRPTMLIGLQDAELDGPGGTQRINEWADWITDTLVPLVEAAIRDAEAQSPDESVQINGVRYADYDTALAAGAFSTRPTERTQS